MIAASSLFYYRLIFLTELFIAEGIFSWKTKIRKHFYIKMPIVVLIIYVLTFFFPLPFFNFWYTSLMFLLIFIMTFLGMLFLFDEKVEVLLFLAVASYITQHIAYQFNDAIIYFFNLSTDVTGIYGETSTASYAFSPINFFIYLFVYALIYFISYLLFARPMRKNFTIRINSISLLSLITISLVFVILINAYIVYNLSDNLSNIGLGLISLISICACGFMLAFQFSLVDNKNLQRDVDDSLHLLREERKQYEQSKQNLDLINQRVHDLKHQIRAIVMNKELGKEVAEEVAGEIKIFDSKIKTGNDILDTILTEKSLECNQKEITITCLLDGTMLNFVEDIDLYTFFGNALDNAIEAVSHLPKEMRVISLTSKERGNTISIDIRNYTDNNKIKTTADKTIVSTKKEPFHGYGTKAMRSIVEKYGGTISFNLKGNIFFVTALFINDKFNEKNVLTANLYTDKKSESIR